jgi:hypothetical protein
MAARKPKLFTDKRIYAEVFVLTLLMNSFVLILLSDCYGVRSLLLSAKSGSDHLTNPLFRHGTKLAV